MPESNQTEQATPRRREKAREKGQVARSRDLIGAASGMAAVFILVALMSGFPLAWRGFFHDCLEGGVSGNLRMDSPVPFLSHSDSSSPPARRLPWDGPPRSPPPSLKEVWSSLPHRSCRPPRASAPPPS